MVKCERRKNAASAWCGLSDRARSAAPVTAIISHERARLSFMPVALCRACVGGYRFGEAVDQRARMTRIIVDARRGLSDMPLPAILNLPQENYFFYGDRLARGPNGSRNRL
jgi:hypothetical protein